MGKFTEEALKDTRRVESESPVLKGVNVHPRDWFEHFGHRQPVKWVYRPLHGFKSEYNIYPDYTKTYGWTWLTEERFKYKYGKDYVETLQIPKKQTTKS